MLSQLSDLFFCIWVYSVSGVQVLSEICLEAQNAGCCFDICLVILCPHYALHF